MPPLPLLLLLLSSLQLLSSTYAPPDKYFIDCGSSCNTTVSDGRIFVGDLNPPFAFSPGEGKHVRDSNLSNNTPPLYHTARLFRDPSSYELKVDHNGTYMVRLHFFPFSSPINLSDAVFEVWADSSSFNLTASAFQLLSNFSVSDSSLPVIEEFLLSINEGKFSLYFVPSQKPSSSFAFVNAIEVFPVPDHFVSDSAAGSNGNYSDLLSHVFHTIHRINVGGPNIRPDDDVLWRNWVPGDKYSINPVAAMNSQFYSTELNASYGKRVNVSSLTWHFPVSKNVMHHLVRFHFCNMIHQAPSLLEFFISVNGKFKRMFKADSMINDLAAPFYVDFVVDSDGFEFVDISIALLPENLAYRNAFLNGLEIFEIKKSGALPIQGQPLKMNQIDQLKNIIDPVLMGEADPDSLRVVADIAMVCLNKSSIMRPTMQDVEQHLIYALSLQQNARPIEPYVDNATDHSVDRILPSVQHMPSEDNLVEGTATISISPDLSLDLKISLAAIKEATNNFDARFLIGEGGFGKVYKGTLKGINVAVKRSEPGPDQGFLGFQREIMVFSQISHPHLVSFIGYCDERSEMILIYELMENGTLRDYLYNSKGKTERSSTQPNLSWEERLQICIGAANGLNYLHTGLAEGIIHRDVKAANILLDEHFVAKVADFGISQFGPPDPIHFSLVVKGTIGYVDPEILVLGEFTTKSDVYAFGVLLLEVICARPAIIASSQREEINLAEWGILWQRKGQLEKIMDPVLADDINMSSLSLVGETAENCLKPSGAERPTMREVELLLKYALELQQSAVQTVSYEDCSTSASMESALPNVQHTPSYSFHVERDDVSIQVDDDFYSLGGDEAPDSLGGDDASDSFFSAKSSPDNMV
ncbi:hypothetical protein UlMin_039144 [Ulmus minor]